MGSLYTVDQLPTTSAAALREFDDRYIAAIGTATPTGWHTQFGTVEAVNSPHVTFPVNALGLKYQATMGESRFKTASETSFDIKSSEFDEGIEARLIDLITQSFAYRNWQQGPSRLLAAEQRFVAKKIAALLEAGTSTTIYDGKNFFATDHPANFANAGLGTFSNYQSNAKDVAAIANIATEISLMRAAVKDENGDKLGCNPDTIFVPTEKYEAVKNLLSQSLILDTSAGVTNPYQGKLNVVEIKELTDVNDWYLVDSSLISQGITPWLALRYAVPQTLGLRQYDESSDFFKDTGKIKVSSHIWYGFSLGLPHAIRKIVGA